MLTELEIKTLWTEANAQLRAGRIRAKEAKDKALVVFIQSNMAKGLNELVVQGRSHITCNKPITRVGRNCLRKPDHPGICSDEVKDAWT